MAACLASASSVLGLRGALLRSARSLAPRSSARSAPPRRPSAPPGLYPTVHFPRDAASTAASPLRSYVVRGTERSAGWALVRAVERAIVLSMHTACIGPLSGFFLDKCERLSLVMTRPPLLALVLLVEGLRTGG
jgi:hypothetical protein